MSSIIEKRVSTIESLKEIVVFLAALTFTNALSTLLLDENTKQIRHLSSIKFEHLFCFLFLIFGVIRFYHGNWRLLDDNYKIGSNRGGLRQSERKNLIWFDFICVLAVALAFALLSFFINDFSRFVIVYAVIVIIDILWLFVTSRGPILRVAGGAIHFRLQGTTWFWNNFGHFLVFGVITSAYLLILAIGYRNHLEDFLDAVRSLKFEKDTIFFSIIVLVLLVNAIIDFISNRQLYFPRLQPVTFNAQNDQIEAVFLAAPFTQFLSDANGVHAMGDYQSILAKVIDLFESRGFVVFNAHRREGWGEKLEAPATALTNDREEIARSDLIIAILGTPASPGVQLEIGYSIALNKPVVVLAKKGEFVPYLNRELAAAYPAKIIEYERETDIPDLLKLALRLK
jgi:nucleoside 2-deoxyribosyltransferase